MICLTRAQRSCAQGWQTSKALNLSFTIVTKPKSALMNFETARSSTDDRVLEFLKDLECKSVVSLYLKGMRDWE